MIPSCRKKPWSVTRRYSWPWCLCMTEKWLLRKKTQYSPSAMPSCSFRRPYSVSCDAVRERKSSITTST